MRLFNQLAQTKNIGFSTFQQNFKEKKIISIFISNLFCNSVYFKLSINILIIFFLFKVENLLYIYTLLCTIKSKIFKNLTDLKLTPYFLK